MDNQTERKKKVLGFQRAIEMTNKRDQHKKAMQLGMFQNTYAMLIKNSE